MADGTKIEWTDATVNAVNGCTVVSPGCTNCYAMKLAGTRMRSHPTRAGLTTDTKTGPVWNGEVRLNEAALQQPLHWRRPRRIFWNAHGDLFHDSVPDAWIDRCFAVMALTPQHQHQVLTKRSVRMHAYLNEPETPARIHTHLMAWGNAVTDAGRRARAAWRLEQWPLSDVWLGVSVEDQQRAGERVPDLLATPAAVRFLSCEPLLGPVDLRSIPIADSDAFDCRDVKLDALTGYHRGIPALTGGAVPSLPPKLDGIDWVIVGGESGPNARPMHPDWARSLRDQCASAFVPFFFKQWGEWVPEPQGERCVDLDGRDMPNVEPHGTNGNDTVRISRLGKRAAGRLLDSVEHSGMPA